MANLNRLTAVAALFSILGCASVPPVTSAKTDEARASRARVAQVLPSPPKSASEPPPPQTRAEPTPSRPVSSDARKATTHPFLDEALGRTRTDWQFLGLYQGEELRGMARMTYEYILSYIKFLIGHLAEAERSGGQAIDSSHQVSGVQEEIERCEGLLARLRMGDATPAECMIINLERGLITRAMTCR